MNKHLVNTRGNHEEGDGRKQRRLSSKAKVAVVLPLVGMVGAFAVPAVTAGAATPKTAISAALKKGLAFYKGKQITWYDNSSSPGSNQDLIVRGLITGMDQYLDATINVAYQGATPVANSDAVAHATPDGLTLGVTATSLTNAIGQIANQPTLNFNPAKVQYFGIGSPSATLMIAKATSGIKNFADLKSQTSPVSVVAIPQVGNTAEIELLGAVYGIPFNYLTGYSSSAQQTAGWVRGDGPIWATAINVTGPFVASGVGYPVMTFPPIRSGLAYGKDNQGAPDLAQVLKQYPPKTAHQKALAAILQNFVKLAAPPFWTQAAVPNYKIDALEAAVTYASKLPTFQNAMLNDGLNPKMYSGTYAKSTYVAVVKSAALAAPYLTH